MAALRWQRPLRVARAARLLPSGHESWAKYLLPYQYAGTAAEWNWDTLLRQHRKGTEDGLVPGVEYPSDATVEGNTATVVSAGMSVTLTNILPTLGQVSHVPTYHNNPVTVGNNPTFMKLSNHRYDTGRESRVGERLRLPVGIRVMYRVIAYQATYPTMDQSYAGLNAASHDDVPNTAAFGEPSGNQLDPLIDLFSLDHIQDGSLADTATIHYGDHIIINGHRGPASVDNGDMYDEPAGTVDPVNSGTIGAMKRGFMMPEVYVKRLPFGTEGVMKKCRPSMKVLSGGFDPRTLRFVGKGTKFFDKIVDCTGKTMPGTFCEKTVGNTTQIVDDAFPDRVKNKSMYAEVTVKPRAVQADRTRTLRIPIPSSMVKKPVKFPTKTKNDILVLRCNQFMRNYTQDLGAATPGGVGIDARHGHDGTIYTADTGLDYQPSEQLVPVLQSGSGMLPDQVLDSTLLDPVHQTVSGANAYDYRPMTHRLRTIVIPFFVDENGNATAATTVYQEHIANHTDPDAPEEASTSLGGQEPLTHWVERTTTDDAGTSFIPRLMNYGSAYFAMLDS